MPSYRLITDGSASDVRELDSNDTARTWAIEEWAKEERGERFRSVEIDTEAGWVPLLSESAHLKDLAGQPLYGQPEDGA